MLTEKQLEMFGDRGAAVFQSAEQDIIADIARRVKKTGRFTETAELQAQALHAAGVSTQEIRKEVMKILNADDEYKKYVASNTKTVQKRCCSCNQANGKGCCGRRRSYHSRCRRYGI